MRSSVRYQPDPIEAESMARIAQMRDWTSFPPEQVPVLTRMAHTVGDCSIVEGVLFSAGAVGAGVRALKSGCPMITDVTMVQAGLKRRLVADLGIHVECFVHAEEAFRRADEQRITRSAAGIRIAAEQFPVNAVVTIGDAPTALMETIRLIEEGRFAPALVVGLPVGFVGTEEAKRCLATITACAWITNCGTRGGSPLAACVVNALMIRALNELADGAESH